MQPTTDVSATYLAFEGMQTQNAIQDEQQRAKSMTLESAPAPNTPCAGPSMANMQLQSATFRCPDFKFIESGARAGAAGGVTSSTAHLMENDLEKGG